MNITLCCNLAGAEERLSSMDTRYVSLTWEVACQPEFGPVFDNIIPRHEPGVERLEQLSRALGVPVGTTLAKTCENWMAVAKAENPDVMLHLRLERPNGYPERWSVSSYRRVEDGQR